ncbi:MAG: MFS transporter [Deltaproteobacteria bacterium]|nr:MFS transporter [Deltaproteobacteria bacterium]
MAKFTESKEQDSGNDLAIRRAALIVATLTSFMIPFVGSSINIALPAIGETFQMNAVLLSWVATSYLLSAAVFLVPFGRLADIYGRKKIFAYGIVTFTLSSFLSGISVSSLMLILFRIFHGMGSAMIFATGIAILTSVFPPEERGRALGINVAAVYIGLSLGPFLGGFLTQHMTWRSIFFVNVPVGMIIILLVHWKLKSEWAAAKGERFDMAGAFIYGLSLVAIMYGISRLPSGKSLWIILFGFLGIGAFVKWERRVEYPVFKMTLFSRNRIFAFSCLAALIHYSATFAVTFLLSLYLQYIKGLSPQLAGLILIAQPVMMAIFSPFAGRLSDKVEPRIIATLGMALTTLCLAPFIFLTKDSSVGFIVVNLLVLGFGYAFFSSPNTNAIMGSVDKRFYGLASGSVGTMRLLGMMISMGIATVIFTLFMGRVQIIPEYYPAFINSMKAAFMIFAILCFFGIFSSLARGRLRGSSRKSL